MALLSHSHLPMQNEAYLFDQISNNIVTLIRREKSAKRTFLVFSEENALETLTKNFAFENFLI